MDKEATLEDKVNILKGNKFQNSLNIYYSMISSFEKGLIKASRYIVENGWKFLPIGLERYYFRNKREKSLPNRYSNS
jgi:hypothetical protein